MTGHGYLVSGTLFDSLIIGYIIVPPGLMNTQARLVRNNRMILIKFILCESISPVFRFCLPSTRTPKGRYSRLFSISFRNSFQSEWSAIHVIWYPDGYCFCFFHRHWLIRHKSGIQHLSRLFPTFSRGCSRDMIKGDFLTEIEAKISN